MTKAAVIIGVDRVGALPRLQAAASGARDFAEWATEQHYKVHLLTDGPETVVTLAKVKEAVSDILRPRDCHQLIVYFAGHGILKAPEAEIWLLSNATSDADEAIDMSRSIFHARSAGIPHLLFISDACRSASDRTMPIGIGGGCIFPVATPNANRPEVDHFYACLPGDVAYEVPVSEAVAGYQAIFTECLLAGVRGPHPEVVDRYYTPSQHWVISSSKLKPYLERSVPVLAHERQIGLVQHPEIRVESHPPTCLIHLNGYAKLAQGTGSDPAISSRPSESNRDSTDRSITWTLDELIEEADQHEWPPSGMPTDLAHSTVLHSRLLTLRQHLLIPTGYSALSPSTGFTIDGDAVDHAAVLEGHLDVFVEDGRSHIRVHVPADCRGTSVLMRFTSGSGTVLAALPGFIGLVLVEAGRVVNVSYRPSPGLHRWKAGSEDAPTNYRRHAFVAAAALEGRLRALSTSGPSTGSFLRLFKGADPTLGLHAAYAYTQDGAFEEVQSLFRVMNAEPYSVPFDIALIASATNPQMTITNYNVAPILPMMTQGWGLLPDSHVIQGLRTHSLKSLLVPALWTTLSSEGVDKVNNLLFSGGAI